MITFQDLVKSLPSDPNQKGLEFEKICKWYLLNSPFYKKQIKNVWLWSEWKDRWSNQDRGIDLIAETKSGEIWAVQAKAYDSKNQTLQIGKYKYFNNLNLGYWVHQNREKYKRNTLDKEFITLLEKIEGWSWKVYK